VITLQSVNVGMPEVIGFRRGGPVLSGFRKRPIEFTYVDVGEINIAGDAQADLRAHGGHHKAVYAYCADHFAWWTKQVKLEHPVGPGTFGENLTISGIDEAAACIGDVWRWGTVVLQVSQPRYPCYKMAMATGRPAIVKRFLESNRSGWYLRVLEEGEGPVGGEICLLDRDPAGLTVRDAARASWQSTEPERLIEIAGHPALAPSWANLLRHNAISPV
jgi:MOSC domain-containing protein YiiM